MKLTLAVLFVSGLTLTLAASRSRRAAYDLPDGAELLVGAVRTAFLCTTDGYYADVDNNCQIFHVCHTAVAPDGKADMQQWSFLCGNQTVFDQLSFTCAYPEDAVPCSSARDFFYLNANLGVPNVPFLTEQDVARAAAVIPGRAAGAAVFRPAQPVRPQPNRPFRG